MKPRVCVVGMGYVGIPVALLFAKAGIPTAGIELSQSKIAALNRGEYPLHGREPGIGALLRAVRRKRLFTATSDYSVIRNARAVVICVQTPLKHTTHEPDYSFLMAAAESVGRYLRRGQLVSVESTIAPGTMEGIVIPALERTSGLKAGRDFSVVHCPERVTPGSLLADLRRNERVIGGLDASSIRKALRLYHRITAVKFHPASLRAAEAAKTSENAYRDVQIAFANELALICEGLGIDFLELRRLVNTSPGRHVHLAGTGVGGHCIPKDPWLLAYGTRGKARVSIIPAARALNERMPSHLAELVKKSLAAVGRAPAHAVIAVLGFTYRENSDDIRETPVRPLVRALRKSGAEVRVFDPFIARAPGVPLVPSLLDAVQGADAVVVGTGHDAFKKLSTTAGLRALARLVRTRIIVDGRFLFDPQLARRAGFLYTGIGRAEA